MFRNASVAVVVPAFNEGAFVGEVLDTVPAFVDKVYAVDDCSTDDTWMEIQARARPPVAVQEATDGGNRSTDQVVPIRHAVNRGRGAAVKTGYRHALEDGMDVAAVMDGDGQMDPQELHRLVEPVVAGRAAYAKGNRLDTPAHWRPMSSWRLFGNLLLTGLTRIASGYWTMRDPQNGYTSISAAALDRIDLDRLYDGYGFLNDLLIELNVHDFRIVDVPMPAVYGNERSGIRYSAFVPSLSALLLRTFIRRLFRKYVVRKVHPVALLYGLGATGAGLAVGRLVNRWVARWGRRLGAVPARVGLLCVGMAMLLDRWTNDGLVVSPDETDES